MRIYRSDALRNAVVEDHLWCIDVVICNNRALMVAAHLDYGVTSFSVKMRSLAAGERCALCVVPSGRR